MIELSPKAAIMLYLLMTLFVLLSMWGWNHYKSRKKEVLPPEHVLITCEYCHYAYLEKQAQSVSQCPQCQSYNSKKQDRGFKAQGYHL